jgi:hypothetical protein
MKLYHRPRLFAWLDTETTGLEDDDVPIEVACTLTDEYLNVLGEMHELIRISPLVEDRLVTRALDWADRSRPAYAVHQIPFHRLADEGKSGPHVVEALVRLLEPHFVLRDGIEKPILVTDNPTFDHKMLRILFWQVGRRRQDQWPFHHNPWSPTMLWAAANLPYIDKPHRADLDVRLMLEQTRLALEVLDPDFVPKLDPGPSKPVKSSKRTPTLVAAPVLPEEPTHPLTFKSE